MEKSIDALKEVVVSLRNVADDNGFEYQAYYGLEEDDWDVIKRIESEVVDG